MESGDHVEGNSSPLPTEETARLSSAEEMTDSKPAQDEADFTMASPQRKLSTPSNSSPASFSSADLPQSSPGTSLTSLSSHVDHVDWENEPSSTTKSQDLAPPENSPVRPTSSIPLVSSPSEPDGYRSGSLTPVPDHIHKPIFMDEGMGSSSADWTRSSGASVGKTPATSHKLESESAAQAESVPVVTSADYEQRPRRSSTRTRKPVERLQQGLPLSRKRKLTTSPTEDIELPQKSKKSKSTSVAPKKGQAKPKTLTKSKSIKPSANMSKQRGKRIADTNITVSKNCKPKRAVLSPNKTPLAPVTPSKQSEDDRRLTDGSANASPGKTRIVKLKISIDERRLETDRMKMADLSQRLAIRTKLEDKPPAEGQPSIWALDRQALCETLPYYRSYQGACYMKDGIVRAMMFDENGHGRDFMDSDVIISRAGGGMGKDKAGNMIQVKAQSENAQSRSMRNNMKQSIPIVIISGDKNAACPSKIPHRYCVLGFFKVTDVISSKGQTAKQNIIQYRFEKLNSDRQQWWEPLGADSRVVGLGEYGRPESHQCCECEVTHEQVYLKWVCLTPECSAYWKSPNGAELQPSDVEHFNPRWLKKKTVWENEDDPFDLRHPISPLFSRDQLDLAYSQGNTRGICCPICGKCNSRYKYEGWVCREDDHGCDFAHKPSPMLARQVRNPARAVGVGQPISYDVAMEWVDLSHKFQLSHRINFFQIPGLEHDLIVHMIANKRALEEHRGPDDMFRAMQEQDIGLERRFMVSGKAFGRMSAFSVNHGYPYKFVATVASRPFDNAPWVIPETRTQLNFFSKVVLRDKFPNAAFNELLTFAYLEGQKIKYHDDGETGLGPTVATFSLGAPAEMRFRLKKKYWSGIVMKTGDGKEVDEHNDDEDEQAVGEGELKKKGKFPYFLAEQPLPNTQHFEARKMAFESLQGLSPEARDQRCRKLPQELGLANRQCPALIKLYLAHGDKIIMHGEAIQKYFEHEVEPVQGHGVRFANTCREILPHHLGEKEQPTYEVAPDCGVYNGSNLQ